MDLIMNFSNVQYVNGQGNTPVSIKFTLNGKEMSVPLGADGNIHYDELMRQVNAKTLTIEEAD